MTSAALLKQAQAKLRASPRALADASAYAAPSMGWPELDHLPDAIETAPQAFPFHGLGKLLGDAARSIAQGVQAPDALAGGSVLASAALAAQTHADVVMPHGQRAPLSVLSLPVRCPATARARQMPSPTCQPKNSVASKHAHTRPNWRHSSKTALRAQKAKLIRVAR